MRLYAGSKAKYIEYVYTVKRQWIYDGVSYKRCCMQDIIASNVSDISLNWQMKTPMQEQNHETQQAASTIYFKYLDESPDNISESSEEKKSLESRVKWVWL